MRFLFFGLAFVAGAAASFQVPINAALRSHLAHPMQATFFSFLVGMLVSLACCLVVGSPPPTPTALSGIPWWTWTGGMLGMLYVASSIVISPRIGVSATLSMIIAGQMVMSLLIDHYGLANAPFYPMNSQRIIGALLVAAGAAAMTFGK